MFSLTNKCSPSPLQTGFAEYLSSHNRQPGFSNETIHAEGTYVNRSFLAGICDQERLILTFSPCGISVMEQALAEFRMSRSLVLQGALIPQWIEETNYPSPSKVRTMLATPTQDLQADWIWIDFATCQHMLNRTICCTS